MGLAAALLASLPAWFVGFASDDLAHRLLLEGSEPTYRGGWFGLYDFMPPSTPAPLLVERGLLPWFSSPELSLCSRSRRRPPVPLPIVGPCMPRLPIARCSMRTTIGPAEAVSEFVGTPELRVKRAIRLRLSASEGTLLVRGMMTDEAPAGKSHWIQSIIIATVIAAIGGLIAATLAERSAESSAPTASPSVINSSSVKDTGNVSVQHLVRPAEERTYLPLEPSP